MKFFMGLAEKREVVREALALVAEDLLAMPSIDLVRRMLAAVAAGDVTLPEAQASLRALEAVRLARTDRRPCQPEAPRRGGEAAGAALSPFAMRLTTTARRCREAGASVVCRQGYRMILRNSGGRHGDRDHPINLLGMLDGTVSGAKPQNVLGSLRVTEQDCSAVACLMLADIWEHSAHRLGRPERDYSDTVEHLRRIGRGEPSCLSELRPCDVIEDAEQLALSLAGGIMRKKVAEACAWGASVVEAERVGLESWKDTWDEFSAIARRYLLPDPPDEPGPKPQACP